MLEIKQSDLRTNPPKKVVFAPKDSDGTATTVQDPQCSSSNDLIVGIAGPAEVAPNPNDPSGLSKLYKFPLAPGDQHTVGIAALTFTGDADLGAGVQPVNFMVDVQVSPDNASGFDVFIE
jgi:hypothetical protein